MSRRNRRMLVVRAHATTAKATHEALHRERAQEKETRRLARLAAARRRES